MAHLPVNHPTVRKKRGNNTKPCGASSNASPFPLHSFVHSFAVSTEHNRAEVARGSIGAVVHVAKLMADDPVLVCTVSAAVYNFVSRQGGIDK